METDNGVVYFSNEDRGSFVSTSLRIMQKDNILCDVTLESEDGELVRAHRVVLAANCPYFHAMFTTNLSEGVTTGAVKIWEVEGDILRAVVTYCYASQLELPASRILALLCASDRLGIVSLFDECSLHLEDQLSPTNCLSLRAYAELYGCERLYKLCTQFVCDHFSQVVDSEEFVALSSDQLECLLSMDELKVMKEEEAFEAVVKWVKHDVEHRQCQFVNMLSYVRFPFVSMTYLKQRVETEELIQLETRCQEFLQEAYIYKTCPDKRATLKSSPRARPRNPSGLQSVVLCAGGLNGCGSLAGLEQYNPQTDSWCECAKLQQNRYAVGVCMLQENLFIVGGYTDKNGPLSTVYCYNMREAKWSCVSAMNSARRYHDVAILYGLIYAIGGSDNCSVLNSVERYDPVSDLWTFIQPMSTARMYHRVVELTGSLFAIGGHNGNYRLDSVECYNPGLDQWSAMAPMTIKRSVFGAATLAGLIYVVGGYDGKKYLNDVEVYDVELDKWSPSAPLSCARSAVGVVAHDSYIYCCGGFNGQFLSSVERYSPGESWWEQVVPMMCKRAHFGITCTF